MSNRYFRYASSNIPHVSKRDKGGEDAWLAQDNLLVVADGVGGWIQHGIDSGLYSKQLVRDIKAYYDKNNAKELREVLVESVKANTNTGSTTCVLAKFDTTRHDYLKTTNLGDSGYIIFRPDEQGVLSMRFRSQEQQYSFNFPYQCGTGAELPYKAYDTEHEIQDDDIIVMASDGVFDNLYNGDIKACVSEQMKGLYLESPKGASDCIANLSLKLGNMGGYLSPFAKNARDSGVDYPPQGKADDIAVIVAQIHTKGEGYVPQEVETNGPEIDSFSINPQKKSEIEDL